MSQPDFTYEMEKKVRRVLKKLMKEDISRSEWKTMGTGIFPDSSDFNDFIEEIDEFYDEIEESQTDDWQKTYFRTLKEFKNQIYVQLNQKINQRADQFSQILAMGLDPIEDSDQFWMIAPEVITDWHRKGVPSYSIITAAKGKGKTSTQSYNGQLFLEAGTHLVVGNIPMKGKVEGYRYTAKMSEVLLEAIKNTREGMNTLFEWDEATLSLMKAQATKKASVSFEKIDTLLRKFKIDIQISYVLDKDVHTRLELQWGQRIRKLSKKKISIEQRQGTHNKKFFKLIEGWPDADWPYDSENFDVLEIDFVVDDMLGAIGTTDSMEEKLNIVEDWLRNIERDPYLRPLTKEQKALTAYRLAHTPLKATRAKRRLTQHEIGKIMDCSQAKVNRMLADVEHEMESSKVFKKKVGELA